MLDVAARAAERHVRELAEEFLERRMALGLTQTQIAAAGAMSRNHYADIEHGRLPTVGIVELNRIATVLGLDLSIRAYPGGPSIRDAGQTSRLAQWLRQVRPPLTYRVEVPLPYVQGRWEQRAWDAMLFGRVERTAIELEMRLRDVQAVRRRHALKRRDDPTERFLLLIADTRHNRRVIGEFPELFDDLPRLRPSVVRAALEAGEHPPTGLLLV